MMDERSGVTRCNLEKCHHSFTLYSSRSTETAHLIDIQGREVHRWDYPQGETWHYAHLLPDGHLVAIAKDIMILELDWDSRLVWKAETRAHHDFDRLPNGNTLVVSRRDLPNPWRDEGTLALDILLEVTPGGEIVWEWKVEDHADEIGALVPLMMPPWPDFRDWPHINTLEILPESPAAAADPRFAAGNLLFCGRHIDTIGVIDRATGQVVWAWGPGELLGPHMPTMLPNGHLLVYDNGHNASVRIRDYTRILELDPVSGEIVWQFVADPPQSFYSPARGSNERLPNGNTFIAESNSGRLFEVTPEGEMVWEFLTPDVRPSGHRQALYRALRYERPFVERLLAEHAQ